MTLQLALTITWALALMLMILVAAAVGCWTSLGALRRLAERSEPAIRLRDSTAPTVMQVPSMASGIVYPPWIEMCRTINEAGILTKADGSNPSPREIFLYSDRGDIALIYMWYCLAACYLGRLKQAAEAGQEAKSSAGEQINHLTVVPKEGA